MPEIPLDCTRTLKPATVKVAFFDGSRKSLDGLVLRVGEFSFPHDVAASRPNVVKAAWTSRDYSEGFTATANTDGVVIMEIVPGKYIKLTIDEALMLVEDNMTGTK